jgi:DnaJ like chaperone protein
MTGYFELDEVGQEVAAGLFARAERKRPDFEKAVRLVRNEIEPENYSLVIDFLGAVGRAAGSFTSRAQAFIQRLADAIGAGQTRGSAASPTFDEVIVRSYRTLELEPGARLEEVRAAYRRLALDYHPDKVETLAAGFREYATARMQAINEAYQVLKAHLAGK